MAKKRSAAKRSATSGPPRAAEIVGAAQAADVRRLERLLTRGADLNAMWRNYRPLHALIQEEPHAASKGDAKRLACMAWLLAHGADPNGLGAWPRARAVLVAAFGGVAEYVEHLLEAGARVDLHVYAALGELASARKSIEREPAAVDARDEGGLTPLQCCAGSRLFASDPRGAKRLREIAVLLLDAGADANARVRSWGNEVDCAYFAIGAKHLEMLELLLARGADPGSALASGAWQADKRFAEAALQAGAVPDRALAEGRPVLNELVRWGQVDSALWLLERGASPNVPDARGWTALHQAVSRGNERLLAALLAAGGDPRHADSEGISPFEMAVAKGKPTLVAVLRGERANLPR